MTGHAAKQSPEALDFEGALARLEEIVAGLETGDLGLEAALAAFEEGVALSRRCSTQLDDAERRIEILVQEGDDLRSEPLETDEDET
ncbi:MAG: exodeoxyribonuclease VII small subunit [bacterium]|nr:exodeoxyribonuclease VII small subunit [bacterium]